MREGWKEVTLGEVTDVINGFAFKSKDFVTSGVPLVKIKELKDNRINLSACDYLPNDFKVNEKFTVNKGDVIIALTGSHITLPSSAVGRVAKSYIDQTLFLNQRVGKFKVFREKCDIDYLYFVLTSDYFFNSVGLLAKGAANQANISGDDVKSIQISLPPLETQRKIASILSAYDDLIENNLKRIKILEEMAQQTYEEWFVNQRIQNRKIEIEFKKSISELTDFFINGGWGKEENNDGRLIPGYVIRGTDMPELSFGKFTDIPLRFHTKANLKSRVLEEGDIIIEMSNGNINNIGRSIFISNSLLHNFPHSVMCASFCKLLRPKSIQLGILINQHIKMIYRNNSMLLYKSQAANGINNFKFELMIDSELINIPSEVELQISEGSLLNFQKGIDNLQSQNQRLREARDILLPRLMMGIIDTSKISVQGVESAVIKPSDATIIPLKQPKKEASKEFKEAVLIACLTEKFGSEKYPLGRKRYTKLSYLFHRYADNKIQDYLRKAAGPYNPKTKYAGPEKIALNNKYIQNWKGEKGTTGFVAAEKIVDAQQYFPNYWAVEDLDWLTTSFKFKTNDELELMATVDNSLVELSKNKLEFTVANVLNIIKSEKEWEAKLERMIFSEENVERAIGFLKGVLEYGSNKIENAE